MFDKPPTDRTPKIYLSRRNLLTLLSKLDRDAAGEETACTLIKVKQKDGAAYNQTMKEIMVIAVQDEDYYPAQNRSAGEVHPSDEPSLTKPEVAKNALEAAFRDRPKYFKTK